MLDGGTTVSTYAYDANGNRLTHWSAGGGTESGTYNDRDQLVTYAGATYTYNDDGQLTSYDYDALGSLLGVTLPGGTRIDYLIGPAGERLGRKVNGVLQKGWLYGAGVSPVAELDATGRISARFIYATHANVPDYLIQYGSGVATTYHVLAD